jgi:hypothetical protein
VELIGLVLVFPAVLLANVTYALLVHKLVRFRALWPWVLWPSRLVVSLLVFDLASVAAIGAVGSRRSLGPSYTVLHVLVVILGAPAVANLLLIPGSDRWYRRWYVVALCCFVLGMCLVFLQVGVGDALYGPDGVGGPYSQ